jgi:hypothetical protein
MKIVNVPLPDELKNRFLAACQMNGIGMAATVRNLICDFLGKKHVYMKQGRKEKHGKSTNG